MKKLTLVIPAKNESESLPNVLSELRKLSLNTIVVLEKEDLMTIESIKNFENIKIIYQKNRGYGDALIEGINNVKTDYFSIFNADGSFVPKELEAMYNKLENDNIGFVFGSRYSNGGSSEDDTIITLIGNKIFTLMGNVFFSLNITDILYTFVMGKTSLAKEINLLEKDFALCVELPIKAKLNGHKIVSIPCHERPRIAGKKKVNAFKDGFLILKSMIKLFFSYKFKSK